MKTRSSDTKEPVSTASDKYNSKVKTGAGFKKTL